MTSIGNEKGATSVLIVLLMLVLMVFGIAALTTAYASYELANKNLTYNAAYYKLNGQAVKIHYQLMEATSGEAMETVLAQAADYQLNPAGSDLVYLVESETPPIKQIQVHLSQDQGHWQVQEWTYGQEDHFNLDQGIEFDDFPFEEEMDTEKSPFVIPEEEKDPSNDLEE